MFIEFGGCRSIICIFCHPNRIRWCFSAVTFTARFQRVRKDSVSSVGKQEGFVCQTENNVRSIKNNKQLQRRRRRKKAEINGRVIYVFKPAVVPLIHTQKIRREKHVQCSGIRISDSVGRKSVALRQTTERGWSVVKDYRCWVYGLCGTRW